VDSRLRVPEYVTWFPVGATVVLLDKRSGGRSQLEDAAAFLWQQAATGATEDSLVRALARRAAEPEADVRAYVKDWARSLRRTRLLYPLPPAVEAP
jgi:hypothetical protein